jgi:hypothetical protein
MARMAMPQNREVFWRLSLKGFQGACILSVLAANEKEFGNPDERYSPVIRRIATSRKKKYLKEGVTWRGYHEFFQGRVGLTRAPN